jgi:nicotinamidase-related amidase
VFARAEHALIVVDAQKAFVDPLGSLALAHGRDEVQPSLEAWTHLVDALALARSTGMPIVLVRSEYAAGQFTDGRVDDPMGHVCVPGANVDCEWPDGLDAGLADVICTKHTADACESADYRAGITALIERGVRVLCFAGFQLTTCVKATAMSSALCFGPAGVRSVLLRSATGARSSSFRGGPDQPSRVDRTCAELTAVGVDIIQSLERASVQV